MSENPIFAVLQRKSLDSAVSKLGAIERLTMQDFLSDDKFLVRLAFAAKILAEESAGGKVTDREEIQLRLFEYLALKKTGHVDQLVALTTLGSHFAQKGDWTTAADCFETAIDRAGRFPRRVTNLWQLNMWYAFQLEENPKMLAKAERHWRLAIEYFEQDRSNEPSNYDDPRGCLAKLLRNQGNLAEAEEFEARTSKHYA